MSMDFMVVSQGTVIFLLYFYFEDLFHYNVRYVFTIIIKLDLLTSFVMKVCFYLCFFVYKREHGRNKGRLLNKVYPEEYGMGL